MARCSTHAARRDEGRDEPARDRPPRARSDPRAGAESLLHRLPPVVRREPVRQGHLHLGQRRRAARTPLRLHAARRRPACRSTSPSSVDGWVADSAVSFVVGTPRDEDLRLIDTTRAGTGCRASRPRASATASATSRTPSPRSRTPTATRSTPTSAATASAASCTATRTSPTTASAGRGYPLRPGLVVALEPWFLAHDRRDRHRPRRLDAAQRRRLARRALRAHDRDHRGRPDRAHRPLVPRRRLSGAAEITPVA